MMWRSALRRWLLRIGNLVVLQTANPSDYHDTGPVITEIPHTENICSDNPPYRHDAVYPISNVCKLFHKTKSESKNYARKKKKYQIVDKNTAYLLFDAIIRNRI